MKHTNLCFLIRDDQVLLGMKKRGFGMGKWNGFGGKLKEGEDGKMAMVRELREETSLDVSPEDLIDAGTIEFHFEGNTDWDNTCQIFTAKSWIGEPTESEEMHPQWYMINGLPFDHMWIDDAHWVPLVLAGKKIKGEFLFDKKGETILSFNIQEEQK